MRAPMRAKNVKNVVLHGYYNLDGEYLLFEDNPLHGKTYSSVDVSIERKLCTRSYGTVAVDVVNIAGYEPIECELVGYRFTADGTLVISICQDWG